MQSTIMAIRSFLMISCMIVVPVLAIFGTDWLKNFGIGIHASNPRRSSTAAARRAKTAAGAQTHQPGNSPPAGSAAAMAPTNAEATVAARTPGWPLPSSPPVAATGQPIHASFETPIHAAPLAPQATTSPVVPIHHAAATTPMSGNSTTAPPGGKPVVEPSGPGPGSSTDWFHRTQHRLRELGATYYLLETWGRNGELFRFHCKMAINGNPDYTRHFESTDSDVAQAMQQVLGQVEAWRAGRDP